MLALRRCAFVALGLLSAAGLTACGNTQGAGGRLAQAVTPYKADIVQGNFVSREQVEALAPGMSRQQVREILGTPLVTSLFHADRWDYVFTLNRPGVEKIERKLSVFFKGDVFERSEGDAMPSESEFVASLGRKGAGKKVPQLEATPEQLARFPAPAAATPVTTPEPAAPAATSYPPLEAPAK